MKHEWAWIGAFTLGAAVFFLTQDAWTVAFLGWISLLCGLLFLGYVWSTGREASTHRHDVQFDESLVNHRWHIAILTTFILVGVAGIEIAVRKVGGLWGNPWFVAFHLCLVIGMTATFIAARFRFTGDRDTKRHRPMVYIFMVFYAATFVTGTILMEQRFHFSESFSALEVKGE